MPIVAHLDLDAFFAAVEELERPELRTVPLVVGGDPHGRGVVATANYVARRFGVVSAMSCAEALRRCPHAVFVRPRGSLYREHSREVWAIVREIVPTVEQAGIDEGYLDLGESRRPSTTPERSPRRSEPSFARRTRLSCSLGVATSKVVAKVASDRRKPGGLTVVRPGREAAFLAPLPTRVLPGVGPRAAERLAAVGIETIGGLAALEDDELRRVLPGRVGLLVRDRARGIDPRPLDVSTERISISSEETFERDVGDLERLHDELRRMAVGLARHLSERGQTARTVTTKLRYPDFAIRTRSTSVGAGTDDARAHRRARLLAARPRPARPARAAAARRRRRVRPRRPRAARAHRLREFRRWRGIDFAAEIRVRFAETDAQGVVHNSNYFVWFEVARVEFLERFAGGYQRLRDLGIESFVLESHARFVAPAVFDDRLLVHTRCLDVRGARFRFEYAVERVRRGDRRRLDGPCNGRCRDTPADADPGLAGGRYCNARELRVGGRRSRGFGFAFGFGFGFGPTRTTSGEAT